MVQLATTIDKDKRKYTMSFRDQLTSSAKPRTGIQTPRLRQGYFKAVVTTNAQGKTGTAKTGDTWYMIKPTLDITGPDFRTGSETHVKMNHTVFIPSSAFLFDKNKQPRKTKDGDPITNLPELTGIVAAFGGPTADDENPLAFFDGIEGVSTIDVPEDADFNEWLEQSWSDLMEHTYALLCEIVKPGVEVVVKYLSGNGGEAPIERDDGTKVYDNAEIKQLLPMTMWSKVEGQVPSGSYDQTRFQYLKSKSASEDESNSVGADAGNAGGRRPVAASARTAAPRAAVGGTPRAGRR